MRCMQAMESVRNRFDDCDVDRMPAAGRDHVVWHTPGRNAADGMPVGGCDLGLLVWTEGGDVLLYADRSGSFDENSQMLKLGRIRIRLSPNPFGEEGTDFSQTLAPEQGLVQISGRSPESGTAAVTVWAQTARSAAHIRIESERPVSVSVRYESWRLEPRPQARYARVSCFSLMGWPGEVETLPDQVEFVGNRVRFGHHNDNDRLVFDKLVAEQGLEPVRDALWNPQRDFRFGGLLGAEGLRADGTEEGSYAGVPCRAWRLVTPEPIRELRVDAAFHAGQHADPAEWERALGAAYDAAVSDVEAAATARDAWWRAFWARSYIRIRPDAEDPDDPVWQAGRNYNLFRYLLGCNARGSCPTKSNGGLFTMDPVHAIGEALAGETPDYRKWGGGSFTAQNQRLVHWPMPKAGDVELMRPQFDFYLRAWGNARLRTQTYWNHPGTSFTEQMEHFGLPVGYTWGWHDSDDRWHTRTSGSDPTEQACPWVRYQYTGQLEIAFLLLEANAYAGFDLAPYKEMMQDAVRFYDAHYRMRHVQAAARELDGDGLLVIAPSTACETYKDAVNPADAVAGLTAVLDRLIALPEGVLDAAERDWCLAVRKTVPPLPLREKEGKTVLAPARFWTDILNCELPQLYPVFPYGLYGMSMPDIELARNTWRHGVDRENQRGHESWRQDGIFCARLGLVREAAELAVRKLADGPLRFPAFWGPGFDWLPDHNWGGSGMTGLQEMLLQAPDRRILLFPAWPADWDVEFRLHAPYRTTVTGSLRKGIVSFEVDPPERAKDVVVCLEKADR